MRFICDWSTNPFKSPYELVVWAGRQLCANNQYIQASVSFIVGGRVTTSVVVKVGSSVFNFIPFSFWIIRIAFQVVIPSSMSARPPRPESFAKISNLKLFSSTYYMYILYVTYKVCEMLDHCAISMVAYRKRLTKALSFSTNSKIWPCHQQVRKSSSRFKFSSNLSSLENLVH